jgi:short-subunit dehydrogenase
LITGASSGIGTALAGVFAEHGHQLVITARRRDHLEDVASAIAAAGHKRPQIIAADLGERNGPARLARTLAARGFEPAIVVNNAGFGLYGPAADLDLDDQLAMINLDARALTGLSLCFVDSLARHRGGILNVASIAGFLTGKNMAVYFACKAFVVSLSNALHRELAPRGVRVSALCPGPVATGFFGRAGMAPALFPPFLYRPSEFVATQGYYGFMRGQRVIVPGLVNKLIVAVERLFPGRMQARHKTGETARSFG